MGIEEVVGGIEVIALVVGLTELVRSMGVQGRALIGTAMVIAVILGAASYAISEDVLVGQAAVGVRIAVGALWVGVKGLAASGLVKFAVDRAERIAKAAVAKSP